MDTFKKYLYWATIGLFVYMPFHIFFSQWLSTYTDGLDVWKVAKDVFTAGLVSILVCTVLALRKYTRPYLIFVGFAAVYLLLHFVSWFATNQPNDTGLLATVYNNRLVWYLLIGYSLALLFPEKNNRVIFAKILIAVSTVVCLVGIAQWLLPKDIMMHFGYSIDRGVKPNFFIDDKPDFPRIFSTIRDPNSLGAFLLLPSALLTIALAKFWKTPRRMLLGGLLLLHMLAILLTFSRGAWLSIILVEFVILVSLFRRHITYYAKKFVIPIIILAVILLAGVFFARNSYFFQNVILHADSSTQLADPNELRVMLAKKGLEGVRADPEGHGPGTAGLVSTRLPNGLLTENYYLQIAYEVGIVGLLLFIGFLAYIIRLLWKTNNNLVTQALLASFTGLCLMNFLVHCWENEAVAAGWFILAGLSLNAVTTVKKGGKSV